MKRAIVLALASFCLQTITWAAGGIDELQGKWSVKKTNDEGRIYSQELDIAGNRMTFELRNVDGEVRFVAKAKIDVEKAGPLKFFILSDIEGGRSASELEPVDDRRVSVYTVRDGKLVIASNFDRERDNERPSIDSYTRTAARSSAEKVSPAATGMDQLVGTWNLELNVGEDKLDYELKIKKTDGRLDATLVSPRSGEHTFKSIEYKDGELRMETDREIQERQTTMIYNGKLSSAGLAGKVSIKGYDEFSSDWKATK